MAERSTSYQSGFGTVETARRIRSSSLTGPVKLAVLLAVPLRQSEGLGIGKTREIGARPISLPELEAVGVPTDDYGWTTVITCRLPTQLSPSITFTMLKTAVCPASASGRVTVSPIVYVWLAVMLAGAPLIWIEPSCGRATNVGLAMSLELVRLTGTVSLSPGLRFTTTLLGVHVMLGATKINGNLAAISGGMVGGAPLIVTELSPGWGARVTVTLLSPTVTTI
jgi:hypothetical protein